MQSVAAYWSALLSAVVAGQLQRRHLMAELLFRRITMTTTNLWRWNGFARSATELKRRYRKLWEHQLTE